MNDLWVLELGAERHLTTGRLGDASVLNHFTLFIWFESFATVSRQPFCCCKAQCPAQTYFLIANSPCSPFRPSALYTRPYVPLLMKPMILYRSRTRTLLV